jgi:hypothetical protein
MVEVVDEPAMEVQEVQVVEVLDEQVVEVQEVQVVDSLCFFVIWFRSMTVLVYNMNVLVNDSSRNQFLEFYVSGSAYVVTLQIRYLHTQASNQDKENSHVPYGSGSCLPAEAGSDAATYPTALDPTSLLRRAPLLPHVTRLGTPPPYSGGLWYYHVSHSFGPYLPARGLRCFHASHGSGPHLPA